MFKYDNAGKFVNESIDFPFNIFDKNGDPVRNFWLEIDKLITQIKNEQLSKIRYIWIDAGNYCQTEIFLKNILYKNHKEYPVLYLHWIDFVNKDKSVYHQLSQEQIGNSYFINNTNVIKICVIDHAETISKIEEYLELCKKLYENKFIFIFVAKKDIPSLSYWEGIVKKAAEASVDDCYLGILRSEDNYFIVKPYSCSQCKDICINAIKKISIRDKTIAMIETLDEELRRPYYFDFFIEELNRYRKTSEMPEKFDDSNLMLNIFRKAIDGIIDHLRGFHTLKKYLDGYYDSTFVKNFSHGEHSRVPFDNYAWAYGIIYCIGMKDTTENVIATQFCYSNDINNIDFKAQLVEVNDRVVSIFYSESKNEINKDFELKDYFLQMINYSLEASKICASVVNKHIDKIDKETCELVFKSLGERYNKNLDSKEDIYRHFMLGIEIGKLLPKVDNNCIAKGLSYLFECVNDKFIVPKCNSNGISVIPVTNFEFEKFVQDGGYTSFYSLSSDISLNTIATEYYKEIFDFIINALSGNNRKDSNCLARLLKGYGWEHYKQIAYLLSRKDDINNATIYEAIGTNYPDKISYPAKWTNCKNEDISQPFCNPLQPVVCINIFEARAYAKWLSSKINKDVRILNYDPDYLSVIGKDSVMPGTSRQLFILHIEKHRDFINTAENNTLFYSRNDINIKEPSPVGMPNSKYLDLYDFVGNIFETQDTPFTYNYAKNNEKIRQELKKLNEVYIDYNCPGGGLQRSAANWPPEYMGQVPAFLRNQDIGFRIVINGNSIGSQKHTNRKPEYTYYSESAIEILNCIDEDSSSVLSHIHLAYAKSSNSFEQDFKCSKIFTNTTKKIVFYTYKNETDNNSKESIMLVQKEENIFAYYAVGIASIHNKEICQDKLKMTVRQPIIPRDLATRRKLQNHSYAEWVDMIELINDDLTDIYLAYPINILNGYFQIAKRNIRHTIRNGQELKKSSCISNSYYISFNTNSQDYKKTYYESFKDKLGADYFLPDWINIVDFINNICINASMASTLNIETVMAAITTIDTADLHEQINKKILNKKGEGKISEK